MTEFKIGDRVQAIVFAQNRVPIGTSGIVRNISQGYPSIGVEWENFVDGHNLKGAIFSDRGYFVSSDEIKLTKNLKIKLQPIKRHLVLVDACQNFVGVKNSYKEAEDLAKSKSEAVTIYELKEVAKVTTTRQVKKVKK